MYLQLVRKFYKLIFTTPVPTVETLRTFITFLIIDRYFLLSQAITDLYSK